MLPKTVSIDVDEDEVVSADAQVVDDIVDEDHPLGTAKADDIVDEDADAYDSLPDYAITNVDGSVTLPLRFPQTMHTRKDGKVRSTTYDRLTFHRLTGADQRAIFSAAEDMQTVVAFARSTRINQAVMKILFDKLDLADITAGGRVLNSFIATGRKTGR